MERTKNNTGVTFNIALNYGGRDEIVKAMKKIAQQVKNGEIEVEDGVVTLYGNPQDLFKIKNALLDYKKDLVFDMDEITTLPKEKTTLEGEDLEQFKKLLALLDDVDDVQNVYHNVELGE